mgnify:FL=1|jgi:hypothetical protein
MPGYGQEKLQTLVNYDNGEHITLAMNAMKQAQSLLQRPTTTEELTQTLTTAPENDTIVEEEVITTPATPEPKIEEKVIEPKVQADAVAEKPKIEEKRIEKVMDTTTTPGGYEPGKASNLQENLKQSESSGRYDVVNKEGYMGAYQFGDARLTDYKKATNTKFSNDDFTNSKELQDKVFNWHRQDIEASITKRGLDKYIGTEILDIPITKEGLIAVAHLGGKTGMKKFLESNGKYNPADSNGTKLSDYLNKFKGNS